MQFIFKPNSQQTNNNELKSDVDEEGICAVGDTYSRKRKGVVKSVDEGFDLWANFVNRRKDTAKGFLVEVVEIKEEEIGNTGEKGTDLESYEHPIIV